MWKQFFELVTKVFTLTERLDRLEKKVESQESEIKNLTELVNRLAFGLARTNDNIRHSQQNEAHEREKFMLMVENELLKAGRQLPPMPDEK